MNSAHFHLVVNHLPIIFPIAGLIVLAIGIGFKTEMVKRTAYFLFTIGAVSAAMAMNSGEGAEEVVEEPKPAKTAKPKAKKPSKPKSKAKPAKKGKRK